MNRARLIALFLAVAPIPLSAQQPPRPDGVWELETLVLDDDQVLHGLIQSKTPRAVEFAEIVQRPGKPAYAIVRGIDTRRVKHLEYLPDAKHEELSDRFRQLRYRAVIEAGRMEEVRLDRETRRGTVVLRYDGDWFTLYSSADDESTRRCVVRIEQIFRAYRTLLPPRVAMPRRLTIDLYASVDELRSELDSQDVDLDHPALYAPRAGRIMAASELSAYAQQLAKVRGQAEKLERSYRDLDKAFAQSLAKLSGDLHEAGFSKQEIADEANLRRSAWNKEKEETLARMKQQMRRNEARFADVTGAMFLRLYHEALHAYVDAFLYPSDRYAVPQWLHEGLAQVFESGQLDGDWLRLDAPDPSRLSRLQADLQTADRLALSDVLLAEGNVYAGRHDPQASRGHYLYAWAMAYQLVFVDRILSSPRLEEYVGDEARGQDAIERFERLVGMPLAQWEQRWRESMLELRAAGR